jgi:hypothetical protein
MRKSYCNSALSTAAALASVVIISGCASTQPTQATQRYLGYSEAVTQDGQRLFAGASLAAQGRVAAAAELQAKGRTKQTFATTVHLAGLRQAIIRREFPASGFKESFGGEAKIIFSIQRCESVGIENNIPMCVDQPAAAPVVVSKNVLLTGGQKVTVKFPEGVMWTYQVLDQASPLIAD